jgi:hypothetical protein
MLHLAFYLAKAIGLAILIWLAWKVFQVIMCYREFNFYKRQGVVFITPQFSLFTDSI